MLVNQTMIDEDVFLQLIELDEDGSTEFLEGVANDWFNQAVETFASMDDALQDEDLDKFSKLAHFLKGSSGQLGVTTLQHSCSKLQHLGEQWDDEKDPSKRKTLTAEEAIKRIKPILATAKTEYANAEKWLKDYLAADDGDGAATAEDKETPKAEVAPKEKIGSKDEEKPAGSEAKMHVLVKS